MEIANRESRNSPLRTHCNNARRSVDERRLVYRDEFSMDLDRILYSKEFRRLAGKTQVFVSGFDDHFRTRLTHTLEVAQIARTVARALDLNDTLTEAIALGHDVGHTPFGHAGERWLNLIMSGCYSIRGFEKTLLENSHERGFRHNWQSVRAVSVLEEISKTFGGLNLTWYTIWGILHHTKLSWGRCPHFLGKSCNLLLRNTSCLHSEPPNDVPFYSGCFPSTIGDTFDQYWSPEALVVRMADEIAQRHHDIEDGILAGILDVHDTIDYLDDVFSDFIGDRRKRLNEAANSSKGYAIPAVSLLLLEILTSRLIEDSRARIESVVSEFGYGSFSLEKRTAIWKKYGDRLVSFSNDFAEAEEGLHEFLKERVLNSHLAQSMDGKAGYVIRSLFKAFTTNPQQLPDRTVYLLHRRHLERLRHENGDDSALEAPFSVGKAREWLRQAHAGNHEPWYPPLLLRTICDFVAGMTDSYAMEQFELLYGGRPPRRALL